MKRWVTFAVAFSTFALAAGCAPAPKRLTLVKPSDRSFKPGGANEVRIVIDRVNFNEPVKVRLDNLPDGVRAKEKEIVLGADSESAAFSLVADAEAKNVKGHSVTVVASAQSLPQVS
jgi:hypothetical protein